MNIRHVVLWVLIGVGIAAGVMLYPVRSLGDGAGVLAGAVAWMLIPVVYWAKKRQQRKLRQWSRADEELMDKWKKDRGIKP